MHDYFYGREAEQFSFYRVPTVLFTDEQYKDISPEAKILYGILLKRMDLSVKNEWFDEQGRVYIIFRLEEIMERLGCADKKATRLMDELEEKAGLIERFRQGQGKPNLIYVKNFIDSVENSPPESSEQRFLIRQNNDSGIVKTTILESLKQRPSIRPLFDSYENGMPIEKAADELEKVFRSAMEQSQFIDPKDLTDYAKMKDRLILQLIPIEGNEERLNEIPHEQISDFAVICRVELADGEASTIVTDQLMKSFDISKEQLFADAKENAPRLHPPVLKNLMEVLFQAEPGLVDMESPLHVATTDVGEHGACVIAYPGFMDQASETLGGSFFVIPSSVHELLFLRDDDGRSVKELDDMVQAVNAQEVQPSDRLSDVSYHYDAETKTLERSAEWEERREHEAELSVEPDEHLEETTGLATMTVLLVNAEEYPKEIEIATGLESLQQAVQGNIEIVYPFDDPVGIICNEEGKLNGMKLNRALKNDQGEIQDILTGPFLVVGLGAEDFRSLTPDEMKKYEGIFHQPEAFVRMGKGIKSVPIPDEVLKADRTQEPKSKSQEHGAL